MKRTAISSALIMLIATLTTSQSMAGVSFGDAKTDLGQLNVSGTLRVNYQDKDYAIASGGDQKIKFDVAILKLKYDAKDWFGQAEYRCYQYDKFCDFSTLVTGYLGYKISDTDNITVGLQPIPFGPSRYWDSSFYASINNTLGLQDILNIGVNYHSEFATATQIDLAYFAADGGSYHGSSRDAARYTANLIHSGDAEKTHLDEKNMLMARVKQKINVFEDSGIGLSLGGSYWYSDIENNKNNQTGSRKAWALFSELNYANFALTLTGGDLSIDNKDPLQPYSSTFGSFDSEYDVANDGRFYTFDARYQFKNVAENLNLTPYLVYSKYDKDHGFKDSQRHALGVAWDYKNMSLYTEYLMTKNDVFIAGDASSLAEGKKDDWNKLLNLMFIYNF